MIILFALTRFCCCRMLWLYMQAPLESAWCHHGSKEWRCRHHWKQCLMSPWLQGMEMQAPLESAWCHHGSKEWRCRHHWKQCLMSPWLQGMEMQAPLETVLDVTMALRNGDAGTIGNSAWCHHGSKEWRCRHHRKQCLMSPWLQGMEM